MADDFSIDDFDEEQISLKSSSSASSSSSTSTSARGRFSSSSAAASTSASTSSTVWAKLFVESGCRHSTTVLTHIGRLGRDASSQIETVHVSSIPKDQWPAFLDCTPILADLEGRKLVFGASSIIEYLSKKDLIPGPASAPSPPAPGKTRDDDNALDGLEIDN